MSCPPCKGACQQGRACPDRQPRDFTGLRWVVVVLAVFWTIVGTVVVRSCT